MCALQRKEEVDKGGTADQGVADSQRGSCIYWSFGADIGNLEVFLSLRLARD